MVDDEATHDPEWDGGTAYSFSHRLSAQRASGPKYLAISPELGVCQVP
jgi:hypothetical protein